MSYEAHVDRFGFCDCGNPSGDTEVMRLEVEVSRGVGRTAYRHKNFPACADCFGLR